MARAAARISEYLVIFVYRLHNIEITLYNNHSLQLPSLKKSFRVCGSFLNYQSTVCRFTVYLIFIRWFCGDSMFGQLLVNAHRI